MGAVSLVSQHISFNDVKPKGTVTVTCRVVLGVG